MDDGGEGKGKAMSTSTDLGKMTLAHVTTVCFVKHLHVLYHILLIQKPHGSYLIDGTI